MEPLTALTALAPVVVEAARAMLAKFTGGDVKPANFEQLLKLKELELEHFKVLNNTGAGPSYPWVEAIVRLQRPAFTTLVLGVWATLYLGAGSPSADTLANVSTLASAALFYLFGDRTLTHLIAKSKKS